MVAHQRASENKQNARLADVVALAAPTFAPGERVAGWTVLARLEEDRLGHTEELLAADAAGACVVLRVAVDANAAERLWTEADLAQGHLSDHVVESVGVINVRGWPVQVLEHVDGVRLDALASVAIAPAGVARIGHQLARALAEIHGKAPVVCHGALSASHVIADVNGNVRLRDLGRVRPAQSLRHLSPERLVAMAPPSPADDLYALGVLLAEAALGHALPEPALDDAGGGSFDVHSLEGALPSKLVDALAVLLAPLDERLHNAGAAVRIFSNLERHLGDGQASLRRTVADARSAVADEDDPLDRTLKTMDFADAGDVDARTTSSSPSTTEGATESRAQIPAPPATGTAAPRPARGVEPKKGATRKISGGVVVGSLFLVLLLAAGSVVLGNFLGRSLRASDPPTRTAPATAQAPQEPPMAAAPRPVAPDAPVALAALPIGGGQTDNDKLEGEAAAERREQRQPEPVSKSPKAPKTANAEKSAPRPPAGNPVELVLGNVPRAAVARAQSLLRSCGVRAPIVGVLHIAASRVTAAKTDPRSPCVESMLNKALHGAVTSLDGEPFEVLPR